MSKPYAAFDIDGTLIRWQLYHALADLMIRDNLLDSTAHEQIRAARMNWKNRHISEGFNQYERTLISVVEVAMPTISVETFDNLCREALNTYKDQVYTYTRDLILELKSKGYVLFAISASQANIVKLLADYYGFDDYAGSNYEVKDGYFTGQAEIIKGDRKPEVLASLATKHDCSLDDSIAVGDSEGDIPMLESVQTPIAFNPSKQLYNHARVRGWQIVTERKNVIYKLEPRGGSYILA